MLRVSIPIAVVAICLISVAAGAELWNRVSGGDREPSAGAERWNRVSGGDWEPSAEVMLPLQEGLESYVQGQAKIYNRTLREWGTYWFQYQGRAEGGRRYVFVSAVCGSIPDGVDLHKQMVLVAGGSSCRFRVKYDPFRRRFYELTINNQ
jgi:hypothetical protein